MAAVAGGEGSLDDQGDRENKVRGDQVTENNQQTNKKTNKFQLLGSGKGRGLQEGERHHHRETED